MIKILRCDNTADNIALKVIFVILFPLYVPSYHPRLTSSWSNVAQCSTAPRDSATDIDQTSQNVAPEREPPNRSVVIRLRAASSFSVLYYLRCFVTSQPDFKFWIQLSITKEKVHVNLEFILKIEGAMTCQKFFPLSFPQEKNSVQIFFDPSGI